MRYLLVLLAAVSCAFEPEDAQRFTPPSWYRTVWDSAQACSGLRGEYGALRFWVAPEIEHGDEGLAGWTSGRNIYLAEGWKDNALVVKHEMIHALGVHGHPYVPFVDPCHATWDAGG